MAEIQLAIEGKDAIAATEALLAIPGISGNYAVSSDAPGREGVVATVATIIGIVGGAIALYQQSLALNEQIGNVQDKAMTLWWLGHIAEQQGNYNQALDYLQPALEILQRIQSPDAERLGQVVARVQDLIRNS